MVKPSSRSPKSETQVDPGESVEPRGGRSERGDFDAHIWQSLNDIFRQLGKLDTLAVRVEKQGEKLDAIEHKVTFVKGAMWVIGGVLGALILLAGWYFSGKLSITIAPAPSAEQAASKQS